ncbi:ExeA family protein [Sabulicella rubraurantiaca]|uniref:ExeA family protein n=1 Tax=Sabulicella rubraurantiaca TaxID=2811429 RepID=UPI001A97C074|nr:AAA family ATPase [Sabulicella rubraurantiaca]
MLIEHYGLRAHPFLMTPDARLFYASAGHARAYAHLAYGLAQREGFVVVTGEVGAGKTTLVERLCMELDPNLFAVGRIVTSQLESEDLLRLVADSFGVPIEGGKAQLLTGITRALRTGGEAGRRHVLIVDEAQALSHGALEELRMLSNVTENGRAFLQTVLLGQPQLRQLLARPDLEQLRQRILASYHLQPLSSDETRAYVEHRLRAVGWQGRPAWGDGTLEAIHHHTGGVPRRINRLCSRVLLAGALEGAEVLELDLVESTAQELEEDLGVVTPVPDSAMARAEAAPLHAPRAAEPRPIPQPLPTARHEEVPPPQPEPRAHHYEAEPPHLTREAQTYVPQHGHREHAHASAADDPRIAAITDQLDTLTRVAARQERVVDRLINLFARRRTGR